VVLEHLKGAPLQPPGRWVTTQPITYKGRAALQRDIANLKSALDTVEVGEAFLPLAAPASVEASVPNEFYKSDEEYVYALADALREEYLQVVEAGLILQVDDAFIPYNYDRMMLQGVSMDEYRKHCEMRIDAVNHALRGIPEDRIRYHICWGSWAGPHTSDVPLAAIAWKSFAPSGIPWINTPFEFRSDCDRMNVNCSSANASVPSATCITNGQ
jgi:5-methyltetrahydropteroyltriglutamate--homocysteine methyltransferase